MLGVLLLLFVITLMLGVTHYVLPKVVEANTRDASGGGAASRPEEDGSRHDPA